MLINLCFCFGLIRKCLDSIYIEIHFVDKQVFFFWSSIIIIHVQRTYTINGIFITYSCIIFWLTLVSFRKYQIFHIYYRKIQIWGRQQNKQTTTANFHFRRYWQTYVIENSCLAMCNFTLDLIFVFVFHYHWRHLNLVAVICKMINTNVTKYL